MDRQLDAGLRHQLRGMPGDRHADRLGPDFALCRLDPDAGAVLHDKAGHFAILDDVDAERIGGARIAPGDGVVARGAAAGLPDAAVRQVARVERLGHQRQPPADLVGSPELGVDAVELHGVGDAGGDFELRRRVRHVEDAALAQHHVEVELARQSLVEPQREIVERNRFRPKVVRAHDRGVASGVAAAEPTLFDDAHSGPAVVLGEIIGRRQPVAAAADDDKIVRRLGPCLAPGRRPARGAAKTFAQQGPGGIALAHRSPSTRGKSRLSA